MVVPWYVTGLPCPRLCRVTLPHQHFPLSIIQTNSLKTRAQHRTQAVSMVHSISPPIQSHTLHLVVHVESTWAANPGLSLRTAHHRQWWMEWLQVQTPPPPPRSSTRLPPSPRWALQSVSCLQPAWRTPGRLLRHCKRFYRVDSADVAIRLAMRTAIYLPPPPPPPLLGRGLRSPTPTTTKPHASGILHLMLHERGPRTDIGHPHPPTPK